MIRYSSVFLFFFIAIKCIAQFPERSDHSDLIQGAIDVHIHSSPDIFDRSLTDIQVAELSRDYGLKAIVIKNHVSSTSGRVELVNQLVSGIDVYGGVVLNKAVGGINPEAVRSMAGISPQYGKFVWFPTFDAAGHKEALSQEGEGISILDRGKLSAETLEILALIKANDLVLATGHLASNEIEKLVEEAHRMGISKILITHGLSDSPNLSMVQLKQLSQLGAKIELTYLSYLTGPQSHLTFLQNGKNVSVEEMVNAIQSVGFEHFIISSDLGQSGNPIPPDGLKQFIRLLLDAGITPEQIKTMLHRNPSGLLE